MQLNVGDHPFHALEPIRVRVIVRAVTSRQLPHPVPKRSLLFGGVLEALNSERFSGFNVHQFR